MSTVLLSGCAILKNEKILLIRKKDKDIWELPGGIVKSVEDDKVVELEAVEKTKNQIGVEPTIIQQFTVLEYQIDQTNLEASIFECDINPEAEFTPGENIEEVKWFEVASLSNEKIGEDVKAIIEEL